MNGVELAYIIISVAILGFVGGVYAQQSVDQQNKRKK